MVDFASWLRTPALTKVFPALAPVAPQVLRGFFFGLMASSLAVLAVTTLASCIVSGRHCHSNTLAWYGRAV